MTLSLQWRPLPSIPDHEGFASPFAGVANGALVVAGGANFPGKRPWEGGTKIWYDSVFVLEKPDGAWKTAGKLPRPIGYGVALTVVGQYAGNLADTQAGLRMMIQTLGVFSTLLLAVCAWFSFKSPPASAKATAR